MSLLPSLRPGPIGLLCELAGMPMTFIRLASGLSGLTSTSPRGDGHMVLVLPGFTATDHTTLPMRHYLEDLGYLTSGWNLGWNLGITPDDEATLEQLIADLAAEHGPITVVGWSLGGVYAREAARRRPELVRDVITMGTPIRGREGTEWIVRWFRLLNPAAADDLTPEGAERHAQPLPMPMTAIWSPRDGVVSGPACRVREEDEGPLAHNVRVDAAHRGMGFDLGVLRALADALAASAQVAAA
ncbi:alpha/beta hydrolase [Aeromicrobium alkaliterrae]|uniref:Alpha/beta hydrolase n=1 Tax=Aeromicrobium alkaliterrae TaxID=302168 RepID=A0ABN2JML4_9ACTN